MKKYTQEEFDALPVVDGIKQCPSGDYSGIKSFGAGCGFGEGCRFGNRCSFDEGCRFGARCGFGDGCRFGNGCGFDEGCRFGELCIFGEWCEFGAGCGFDEECRFGNGCSFGEWCRCEFGEFYHMVACGGFGSVGRITYFFGLTDGGVAVRCGCFAGTLEEWEAKVRETHKDTPLAKAYLGLIQPVKTMMEYERSKRRIDHEN